MAGRTYRAGMQDYLYNNSNWWLGSPREFYDGHANVFIVTVAYVANIGINVSYNSGLRPVVSILSNTAITEGDGSQLTPWRID